MGFSSMAFSSGLWFTMEISCFVISAWVLPGVSSAVIPETGGATYSAADFAGCSFCSSAAGTQAVKAKISNRRRSYPHCFRLLFDLTMGFLPVML